MWPCYAECFINCMRLSEQIICRIWQRNVSQTMGDNSSEEIRSKETAQSFPVSPLSTLRAIWIPQYNPVLELTEVNSR